MSTITRKDINVNRTNDLNIVLSDKESNEEYLKALLKNTVANGFGFRALDENLVSQFPENQALLDKTNARHRVINDFMRKHYEDAENKRKKDVAKKASDNKVKKFFDLIPEINLSAVMWKVKNQFNGCKRQYAKKHSLFAKCFTKEMKSLCDGPNCDMKKERKEAMLYASQLLGLVGKNGSSYLNESLLKFYQEDMKAQEDFLLNYRLMTKKGKFVKLTTIEDKQIRKNAQILNISSCLSLMAKDKDFTWSMITLTLPPSYHPNPIKGTNSFNGVMPLKAHKQLHHYWKLIRARMAKAGLRASVDYFGCSVFESHIDSTLHMHCLVYTSKENQELLKNIVMGVANSSHEYVRFDFKKSDGRASGSTYIYKYIMKSNNVYTDKNLVKTTAVRYFYSARGFNFFGLKSCLTMFDFLTQNYKTYEKFFNQELRDIFKRFDYYNFIKKYQSFFEMVRGENEAVQFITYDLNGNRSEELRLKNTLQSNLTNQVVIIEKKIFSIFEVSQEIVDKNIESIEMVDLEDIKNSGIKFAYELVNRRCEEYQKFIDGFKAGAFGVEFLSRANQMNNDDIINEKIAAQIERLKLKKLKTVTVKQSDSSKRKNGVPFYTTFEEVSKYYNFKTEKEEKIEEYLEW